MGWKLRSVFLIAFGMILIALALFLAVNNFSDDKSAGMESDRVASQLVEGVEERFASGLGISADTPMPTKKIDGCLYIGILRVPALGLELPVASEWGYEGLRSTPCRYVGSAYSDDLVIAAHNYASHFGTLKELSYGEEVNFTDVRGNAFVYEVVSIEKLSPDAVDVMIDSDYELTLFTCTLGGADRVTVRCSRILA